MSFSSIENKGMLWNTLNEGGLFQNLENNKVHEIKIHFENIIKKINRVAENNNDKSSNFSVLDLNKQFISEFSGYLNSLRNQVSHTKENASSLGLEEIYTSQQISQKRQKEFDYAVKQQQLLRQNTQVKPEEIKFNENKIEEEPIKDMDNQLAKMMAERDLVNSGIVSENQQKKAEEWINNNQPKKNEIIKKQVTFDNNMDSTSEVDILGKLKLLPDVNSNDNYRSNDSFDTLKLEIEHLKVEMKEVKEALYQILALVKK